MSPAACSHRDGPRAMLTPLQEANRQNLCRTMGLPTTADPCHECYMEARGYVLCTVSPLHDFRIKNPFCEEAQEAMHAVRYGEPTREQTNQVLTFASTFADMLARDTTTKASIELLRAMRRAVREAS